VRRVLAVVEQGHDPRAAAAADHRHLERALAGTQNKSGQETLAALIFPDFKTV
jgi:hypothetical protein